MDRAASTANEPAPGIEEIAPATPDLLRPACRGRASKPAAMDRMPSTLSPGEIPSARAVAAKGGQRVDPGSVPRTPEGLPALDRNLLLQERRAETNTLRDPGGAMDGRHGPTLASARPKSMEANLVPGLGWPRAPTGAHRRAGGEEHGQGGHGHPVARQGRPLPLASTCPPWPIAEPSPSTPCLSAAPP